MGIWRKAIKKGVTMEFVTKKFSELTTDELYNLLQLRCAVFVVEQTCPYQDIDGKDKEAYHVFAADENGCLKACLRFLEKDADTAYMGRVITVDRGTGMGAKLMVAGIGAVKEKMGKKQIYLEAQKTKNEFLRIQLIASALRSLEEGKTKMVESIKADIAKIKAHDAKQLKLKPEQLAERISQINASFDVVNRSAQLRAGIYYELGEMDAMFLSLQNYANFLESSINCNQQLLYDYDKTDTRLDGKWHERAKELPVSIQGLIESSVQDQQKLEIDYATLQKMGLLGE